MLTTFGPHAAHKHSGIPWLGDVPEHWEVVQLGRIGVFSKGSGGTKDDEVPNGIPCVRYGDLYTTHRYFINQTRSYISPARATAYTPIDRGDVLFPTSGETIEEIGKSAVSLMHTPVVCGGDLIIFRPKIPVEPKFMGYALDSPPAQTQKSLMGRGITIMHIYSSQLKYLWLAIPPPDEQRAIVRYLDHVDDRIRRYVAAKEKLIALLEEERQAVIHRAVTRGLDPNVPLKPSGIDWLGDIPAHWQVRRSRFLFKEVDIRSTTGQETHLSMSQALGLVPSHLVEQSLVAASYVGGKLCKEGDLVLNRLKAHLGVFALAKQPGLISPDYSVFRKRSSARLEYYERVLRLPALRTELRIRAKGIVEGFWRLYTEDFFEIRLPAPPPPEQTAIVEYLERAAADVDSAITRTRRQIDLLHEYRTRLIADVVTGKLDVREAAAQLPDEAGDRDPIDEGEPLGYDMAEALSACDSLPSAGERTMESEVNV